MKWSFAALGVIALGVIGISFIILTQKLTTENENDYYLLKEVTEAAMIDAIDIELYRETGYLKIVKEKFVENFTRRYAESTVFIGNDYKILFFDIMEGGVSDPHNENYDHEEGYNPPKVTIFIDNGINNYRIYDTVNDYNIQNSLTSILEFVNNNPTMSVSDIEKDNAVYEETTIEKKYYSNPKVSNIVNTDKMVIVNEPINYPEELSGRVIDYDDIKIDVTGISTVTGLDEILNSKLKREIDWARANEDNKHTNYFTQIDTKKYSNKCSINNLTFYDCNVGKAITTNEAKNADTCDKPYENNIWVYYEISNCNGSEAVIKLDTKWTLKEIKY